MFPATTRAVPVEDAPYFVLAYFGPAQDLESDSLHLAYSIDGLHYHALAGGRSVFRLEGFGSNQIRDPFLVRTPEGGFVYLATDWTRAVDGPDYWHRPSPHIVVVDSPDLIRFEHARLLTLTDAKGPDGSERHAWAPEAHFDPELGLHGILWSGNDEENRNRIYVSYTRDFRTLVDTRERVFFDPGYDVIDATLVQANGRAYLFYKDETDRDTLALTGSGKDVQVACSATGSLRPGSFVRLHAGYPTRGTEQGRRRATEGPFVVHTPRSRGVHLFADQYLEGGVFGCWRVDDLDAPPEAYRELAPPAFRFPPGVRHGNTVRVSRRELDMLIAAYGASPSTARRARRGRRRYYGVR